MIILIFFPFEIKKYFTLENLSTYRHITLKFVEGIFTGLLQYFPKNRAILLPLSSVGGGGVGKKKNFFFFWGFFIL